MMPQRSDSADDAPERDPLLLDPVVNRGLFRSGCIGVAGLMLYATWTAHVADPLHLYQGLAILLLACLPSLAWARRPSTQFPIFEVYLATGVNTFALPLLGGHELLRGFPSETITAAAWGVLLFQILAIGTYRVIHAQPRTSSFWTVEVIPHTIAHYLRYGLLLTTAYTGIYSFTSWIPYEANSVLRAVFFGLGTLCTFLLSRALGAGELDARDRVIYFATLAVQLCFLATSLYLVGALSVILLALLGYVAGARRFPFVPALALFALLALLHNGKAQMRERYWTVEGQQRPALSQVPEFYAEWLSAGLRPPRAEEELPRTSMAQRLVERTSLIHILCLVVQYSPDRQPFLGGETYGHIIPQLLPRFFWPDKPFGHVSTSRLSIYYGLQDEQSAASTTIAFGAVAEAYANFGYLGLAGFGCLVGGLAKLLSQRTLYSPILSYPGLFMVLVLAWSFQTELPVSAWIASLSQASIAVLGVPFLIRRFTT